MLSATGRVRVLEGGAVRTLVDDAARAEAIAYEVEEAGRILAVGHPREVRAAAGPGAEVVDLGGRAVVPGFVDAHHHLSIAVLYRGTVDCRPSAAPSLEVLTRRLAEAARDVPPGRWVVGFGFDPLRVAEKRVPTREELDAACPEHPVLVMHFSFHECIVSSRALELAGIGRGTPDPLAGLIVRGRRGEPTGHLRETALVAVETLARQDLLARGAEGFLARLAHYEDTLFARGITRVADPTVTPGLERLYRDAHRAGRLRMPVLMMPIAEGGYLSRPWERLDGPPTGEGPESLRVGPLKLFFDGGDNCAVCLSPRQALASSWRTVASAVATRSLTPLHALTRGKLRLGRDGKLHSGLRFWPDESEALRLARRAVERGFALAIHAFGNEGVAQALDVLEDVGGAHPGSHPPRIEHAVILEPPQARRMADAGICVVGQPGFLLALASDEFPPLPGLSVLAFRSMREAGVRVAGSSDAPVLEADPLEEMRRAGTRLMADGTPLEPGESLDMAQALGLYTREAARACGALDVTGTLEPGKRADLVILSSDPVVTPATARVEETVLAGRTVYEARARP